MEKGYVVSRGISGVELIEVSITGTFTDNNIDYSVIDYRNYSVVWSSDGVLRKHPYFSNKGTFSGNFASRIVRNDVVTDMVTAKQMAQDLLAAAVTATEALYRDCEKRLNEIKQPVDWGTFPKDEYISPFTGKKT